MHEPLRRLTTTDQRIARWVALLAILATITLAGATIATWDIVAPLRAVLQ